MTFSLFTKILPPRGKVLTKSFNLGIGKYLLLDLADESINTGE